MRFFVKKSIGTLQVINNNNMFFIFRLTIMVGKMLKLFLFFKNNITVITIIYK